MPEQEEEAEVLWPYGNVVAVSATVVWIVVLAIVLSLTPRLIGWPSPEMRVVVVAGLLFYGFIPSVMALLDRVFEMVFDPVDVA